MTHVTCRLTAKNRDQLRNPTLGNRVWATFTFFVTASGRRKLGSSYCCCILMYFTVIIDVKLVVDSRQFRGPRHQLPQPSQTATKVKRTIKFGHDLVVMETLIEQVPVRRRCGLLVRWTAATRGRSGRRGSASGRCRCHDCRPTCRRRRSTTVRLAPSRRPTPRCRCCRPSVSRRRPRHTAPTPASSVGRRRTASDPPRSDIAG